MCRWLAYIGKPCSVEPLVYDGAHALAQLARHAYMARLGVQGDGGGLGWYGRPADPGIYRNPGPAWADPNLRELSRHIESRVTFGHVRASSGAPDLFVNCHPFRWGRWMFMHNGQIGGFERMRRHLLSLLSDESFAALEGATDSELIFQLMVTHGLNHDPVHAFRTVIALIESHRMAVAEGAAFRGTFALSDGWRLFVVRWSSDGDSPTLFRSDGDDHLLLVSEPLDEDVSRWQPIDDNVMIEVELKPNWSLTDRSEAFL